MKIKEIIVKLPDNIATYKEHRTVGIDIEIVETIKHLWKNEIQTLGCCSGHGKENPSIVIESGYDNKEIEKIEKIIAEVDNEKWDIFQWRLKKIN